MTISEDAKGDIMNRDNERQVRHEAILDDILVDAFSASLGHNGRDVDGNKVVKLREGRWLTARFFVIREQFRPYLVDKLGEAIGTMRWKSHQGRSLPQMEDC